MNLEDRLRSHMHSGEELFTDPTSSVDDITAAGTRRTRRNQFAVGAAAGVAVLALVFGASNLTGDDPEQVATEPFDESFADTAGAAESGIASDSGMVDDDGTQPYEGPTPAFDIVVGVGDEFAGLRNTDGVITAIRSDDGIVWNEQPTDLPNGINVGFFTEGDGVFAATMQGLAGEPWIATSSDLVSWTLVEVDAGSGDTFVGSIDVNNGVVSAGVTASPARGDDEENVGGDAAPSVFVVTGPPGGPYDQVGTVPDSVVSLALADALTVAWANGNDGDVLYRTADGGQTWTELSKPAADLRVLDLDAQGNTIVLAAATGDFSGPSLVKLFTTTDGSAWDEVLLPPDIAGSNWWSASVDATGDTTALYLQGPGADDNSTSFALVASTGGDFVEVDLTAHMTDEQIQNSMLVALSDEEALFQFFGTPTSDPSLASSSSEADDGGENSGGETSGPGYINVPLR